MSVVVITPPTVLPVDMGAASRHLHIDGDTDTDVTDDDIARLIAASAGQIDGPSGWLGRALINQTLELRTEWFDDWQCYLPYPPFGAVTSIKYDDATGAEQTVDPTTYRVVGGDEPKLILAANKSWPLPNGQPECVRIRYTAGYGEDPEAVPAAIRQAILIMAQMLYGMSERNLFVSSEMVDGVSTTQFVVSPNAAAAMKVAVESLLATYRVFQPTRDNNYAHVLLPRSAYL
jgi:uncharacterized phiE125 gp8 family phage protein